MDATARLFEEDRPQPVQGQGRILIGTSGYSFDDWRGPFYPEKLRRNKWLDYYSGFFPCVEINATYYRTPPVVTFRSMAERTPERFEFWIKVPGAATHGRVDFMPAVKQFLEAVKPLHEAGKLSGFLAQFPQSFQRCEASLDRIAKLHNAVGRDGLLAVEFRHTAWAVDETFEFLERHGIVHVAVDLPPLPDLPAAEVRVTAPASYIRLHGRNSQNWRNPKLGDRYDYNYTAEELKEWLPRIRQLDEKCASTYIFFNNCHAGQAVKNARMLRQLLELEIENQT